MDLTHTGMSEQSAADLAYAERNQLVAALARLFPSGIRKTEIEGWDPEWQNCVFIDLPTGQASWHYHDREAHLFERLPPYEKPWDGHTTPEKYDRLAALYRYDPRWPQGSAAAQFFAEVRRNPSAQVEDVVDRLRDFGRGAPPPAQSDPPGNVLDFAEALERDAERKPGWQTWWATCLDCGHHVVSVSHEDSKGFFECSSCRKMRMVRTAPATE